ncbi:hypothetical protein H5410_048655, partial [Solanum commersonii]
GNGRLRTYLRKCNKEFARLDDIERANRNGIPISENSMELEVLIWFKVVIDYLKCRLCPIDNDSFHIKCAALRNVDLNIEKFQKKYALDRILYLKCFKLLIFIKSRYN